MHDYPNGTLWVVVGTLCADLSTGTRRLPSLQTTVACVAASQLPLGLSRSQPWHTRNSRHGSLPHPEHFLRSQVNSRDSNNTTPDSRHQFELTRCRRSSRWYVNTHTRSAQRANGGPGQCEIYSADAENITTDCHRWQGPPSRSSRLDRSQAAPQRPEDCRCPLRGHQHLWRILPG